MPIVSVRQASRSDIRPISILVVDDEKQVLDSIQTWLYQSGWLVICASSTSEALRLSRDPTLTLALVDYRLSNRYDGIRLGRAMRLRHALPFVLMSGYLNTSVVVEAMKAGALDVVEKPLSENRLVADVRRLTAGCTLHSAAETKSEPTPLELRGDEIRPAIIRWARIVLKACSLPDDPRRVTDLASGVGISEGTLDETCRLCGVTAHDSKDLARILRGIALSRATGSPIWTHLAIADERTLKAILRRAGIGRADRSVHLRDFFIRQTFVPPSRACIRELVHLAANSRHFF